MVHALARRMRADLRSHRLQAVLMAAVIMAATGSLALAAMMRHDITRPWDRLFGQTHGAHIWVVVGPGVDPTVVARQPGVVDSLGPYPVLNATLLSGNQPPVMLRGVGTGPHAAIGDLRLTSGHWLDEGANGVSEIVVEHSFAAHMKLRLGQAIALGGVVENQRSGGLAPLNASRPFRVVGIVATPDCFPYPDTQLGRAFVRLDALAAMAGDQLQMPTQFGVRLADPKSSSQFAARVLGHVLPPPRLWEVDDWQHIRADLRDRGRSSILVLQLFGMLTLGVAGLVTVNAVASRSLAQGRDVGLLKAVGFTPRQVSGLLIGEHLAVATVAGGAGVAIAMVLAPLMLRSAAQPLGVSTVTTLPLPAVFALMGSLLLVVVGATFLPAWRSGRASPVVAITTGLTAVAGRPSRMGRLAAKLRFPTVVVVAVKDAFARPLRTALTVGGLIITAVAVTAAASGWSTLDAFDHHPERVGVHAQLDVDTQPDRVAATRRLLAADRDVAAVYQDFQAPLRLVGTDTEIVVKAIGDVAHPFPLDIREGRSARSPGEGLIPSSTSPVLDALGVRLGSVISVQFDPRLFGAIGPARPPVTIRIVGRYLDPSQGDLITTGLDTFASILPVNRAPEFAVSLRHGVTPQTARRHLLAADHHDITVRVVQLTSVDLTTLRLILVGMSAVLAFIGLANLLATMLLGVRERMREVGLLRAIGLSPRQVARSLAVGAGLLGGIAVIVGVPLGLIFVKLVGNQQTATQGMGSGVVQLPGTLALALLLVGGFMTAAISAMPCAWLAVRSSIGDVLRSE